VALVKISVAFSLANITLGPTEHVIGFEIEVSGGGFESISALPKGWRISIDNKSVSNTQLSADLAYGDEGITTAILHDIVITLSRIELDGMQFTLAGSMLANNLGTERRILLGAKNFAPYPPAA
jgi:hypothetical protein